jgi:hypothetical protein
MKAQLSTPPASTHFLTFLGDRDDCIAVFLWHD